MAGFCEVAGSSRKMPRHPGHFKNGDKERKIYCNIDLYEEDCFRKEQKELISVSTAISLLVCAANRNSKTAWNEESSFKTAGNIT